MILKTGHLRRKGMTKDGVEPYVMRVIGERELPDMLRLQQYVYHELDNKEVLVADSCEEMRRDLAEGGLVIGVYNGAGTLVAYRFVTFPKERGRNLGEDLNLPPSALRCAAHLETTLVHPAYRGNGLQSETLGLALPLIEDRGYRHVLCTVSPMNPHSLFNVMSHGLRIKALKRKYATEESREGLWRFILHRDLLKGQSRPADQWLSIGLGELERQAELIRAGFEGTWLNREASCLHYVKFASSGI